MFIAGMYFSEDVLSNGILTGVLGLLIMSMPLLVNRFSKKLAKTLLCICAFSTLTCIFILSMAMCPPYAIFPFCFFGSFAVIAAIVVMGKELKSIIVPLSFSVLVMFIFGLRVPLDITRALRGEIPSRAEFEEKQLQRQAELEQALKRAKEEESR